MPTTSINFPLLIIDTSSRRTWVGLKLSSSKLTYLVEEQDPSKTLFLLVGRLLADAALSLEKVSAIAFCAGPGSMLGARTASMAIRTWKAIGIEAAKNIYSYSSLQVGAEIAHRTAATPSSGLVVTDARRASWNALSYPNEHGSKISLIPDSELSNSGEDIVTLSEFPRWTKTSVSMIELSYDPAVVFSDGEFLQTLQICSSAEPLTIRRNEFKKWDAKIHSAPQQ